MAVPAQERLKSCGGRASYTSAQSAWFAKPEAQLPACLLNTWLGPPSTLTHLGLSFLTTERASCKQTYLVWFFPRIGLSFGHNDRPNHTSRLQVVTSFFELATPNQNDNILTRPSRSSLTISREQSIPSRIARSKPKQSPKVSNNYF